MSVRPTVLIGYGAYGRAALKRLLVVAALRGRLCWTEAGASGARRLRDLATLWLPEPGERGDDVDGNAAGNADGNVGSSDLELMRDLDQQILRLPTGETENVLDARIEAIADRLLSAAERSRQGDALPLGLDLIVLARPTRPETVGRLDRLLSPVLEALGSRKVLGRGPGSADKLCFLQILDFEDYWHPSPRARRVREALAASVARWRSRAERKEPAFGRMYLIDGQTTAGVKFAKDRLDETVLFLELMLFEGIRDSVQRIFQRRRDHESPICTFGARCFEHSGGLLSRLAAAEFALRWIQFLDAADPPAGPEGQAPSALEQLLAPLEGAGIEQQLGFGDLQAMLARRFERLERELIAVPAHREDWSRQLAIVYDAGIESMERRLDTRLTELLRDRADWLEGLPGALAEAADHDLAATAESELPRNSRPLSAKVMSSYLDRWRSRLAPVEAPIGTTSIGTASIAEKMTPQEDTTPDAPADRRALEDLGRLHDRYRSFRSGQVDLDRLRGFWPLWALAVASVAAPGAYGLWRTVPAPDPNDSHHLLVWSYQIFERVLSPAAVALGLGLTALLMGWLIAQPRLARAAERGRRFFADPHRGRFASALRRELAPGGRLRDPVEKRIAAAAADRVAGVRGRLIRELDRQRRRLRERRREMAWLQGQLAVLLRIHGLGPDGAQSDDAGLRHGSGVRWAAETRGDVRRLLAVNPPGTARFLSMQSAERPFADWRDAEAGLFLRPLDFLDRLSRRFQPTDGADRKTQPEELARFLEAHRELDLSFPWHSSDEVPSDELLCLLPRPLLLTPGVGLRLGEVGVSEEKRLEIADSSRVYLLRLQMGVPAERLVGRSDP